MNHRWSLEEVEEHMSCVCPPGFGGHLCEAPAEQCGKGNNNNIDNHMCLNGGQCVTTIQTDDKGEFQTQHHCDCTMATNGSNDHFAGTLCEHKATSMCSDNDWNLFCTQVSTRTRTRTCSLAFRDEKGRDEYSVVE